MSDRIVFHLKRLWEVDGKIVDLYEEIKSGRKTSEWRDASKYWCAQLIKKGSTSPYLGLKVSQDISYELKVHKAWFVVGYPKGGLPRLVAEITGLIYHPSTGQFEIQFANVREVAL